MDKLFNNMVGHCDLAAKAAVSSCAKEIVGIANTGLSTHMHLNTIASAELALMPRGVPKN